MMKINTAARRKPGGFRRVLRAGMTLLCLGLIACGPPGDEADSGAPAETTGEDQARALREIATLGYVAGSEPVTEDSGVILHRLARTRAGLNFYGSGHARAAFLMDMEGRVLHEWSATFEETFGRFDEPEPQGPLGHTWRRVKLLDDGSILAIQENVGLVKVDRDSKVVWSLLNRAHHDVDVDEAGRIYVVCREAQYEPRFGDLNPVLLDYVGVYDADGGFIQSISIDQAYKDSEFPVTTDPGDPERDIYHTNTLQILDGALADRHPAFRRGHLLLSFRCLDEIAVLDPERRRIVWRMRGDWRQQHEPVELRNGHIVLFDNIGLTGLEGSPARVLEIDPLSGRTVWSYEGPAGDPLRSFRAGSVQRLDNGNTLITASIPGRAIEVTPDKTLVWEFLNPHRTGRDLDRRAGVSDVTRVDPAFVESWLELPPPDQTSTSGASTPSG